MGVTELNHALKKVCTLLVLLTYVYHDARFRNRTGVLTSSKPDQEGNKLQ